MALPGQDRIGYAVSELMQRMQIYGTYVLGVYEIFLNNRDAYFYNLCLFCTDGVRTAQ